MFLDPFTQDLEGRETHCKDFLIKKNANNMLMQNSTNFLKIPRLNMSITCLMIKNKMDSLNVIIKLWWKQQKTFACEGDVEIICGKKSHIQLCMY